MEPTPAAKLNEPKQWKAISHPLRLEILALLATRNLTNEELAAAIGVASGKLYFHTKKLLDAGLIALAEIRQKGPRQEKVYRRTFEDFWIEMVEDGSAPPLAHFIRNALANYEAKWAAGQDFAQYGFHLIYYHTPQREKEFYDRLTELMNDFRDTAVAEGDNGGRLVSLAALMHTN
jgi:hypothetical protein